MAKSIDVANEFIKISREARRNKQGRLLSQMDLMKMMFFAHGVSLAKTGKPLITDDTFEAWYLGPVLPNLYRNHTKQQGKKDFNNIIQSENSVEKVNSNSIGQENLTIIKDIYYSLNNNYTAPQLSNATHRYGSVWSRIYFDESKETKILENEEIKKDFSTEGLIDTNSYKINLNNYFKSND